MYQTATLFKRSLLLLPLCFMASGAWAAPKCATPDHPDICAKLIQFFNEGSAAGILNAGEWNTQTQSFHLYDKDKWRIKVTNSPTSSATKQKSYTYDILLQQTGTGTLLQRIEKSIARSMKEGRIITLNYNNQYAGAAGKAIGTSTATFDQSTNINQRPTEDHSLGQLPQSINIALAPDSMTIQHASNHASGKKIDKHNINQSFITSQAGSHINQNTRSFLVDSEDKAWSCKISGMGMRTSQDQYGKTTHHGHAETIHFQSRAFSHIPANHAGQSHCLIAVHK